jgi:tripartite-type tricarboxylate transporter receptor subunit TctC
MKKQGGMDRREFLKFLGAAGVISSIPILGGAKASAAEWPSGPIRAVIGYAAGGGTDMSTRAICSAMEGPLNATINATNMPGAIAGTATNFVLQKPADGYWILGTSNYNKFLRTMKISDSIPWKDWQWFPSVSSLQCWTVKPDSPFKTFQDLLDEAKKRPLTISTSGVGGIWHEGDGILAKEAGIKFEYIPYKGGAPAALAVLQGEVEVGGSGVHEAIEYLVAGKLKILASGSDKPLEVRGVHMEPVTQYVPSLKSYTPIGAFITIGMRRETPLEILEKVRQSFVKGLQDPKFREIMEKKVMVPVEIPPLEADRRAALSESVTSWTFKELGIAKADPEKLGIPKPEEFDKWWPPKDYKPRLK